MEGLCVTTLMVDYTLRMTRQGFQAARPLTVRSAVCEASGETHAATASSCDSLMSASGSEIGRSLSLRQ
jgi:hypothetical protein